MPEKFYRRYIQGVISNANCYKATVSRNFVYNELTGWLKDKGIRLESEMFRAALAASRKIFEEYQECGTMSVKETSEFTGMFFHTFTALDGIHTDSEIIASYVTDFFPVLQDHYENEKALGSVDYRLKKVDVARLGKLFDEILREVEGFECHGKIEELFDNFVRNDLEE